jgi:hypothetical protein
MRWVRTTALLLLLATAPSRGGAPEPPRKYLLEGRLLLSRPVALGTGMCAGVGLGYARGRPIAWGLRLSWGTATEYTESWTVRHDDFRLRATAALVRDVGRGRLGLRLGVGATLVREDRALSQGARAGLSGEEASTIGWRLLPAAELEPTVLLRVYGAWGVSVSGGPALYLDDRSLVVGWLGGLGVAWQP